MSTPEFSSEITVQLKRVWGTDLDVPEAARVSSKGWDEFEEDDLILTDGDVSLIEMLSDNDHTSPFEHMGATFYVHVPIFVMREWMRHRTQSYNEESGRWKVLGGKFYIPDTDRPTKQIGRTGEYSFVPDERTNEFARVATEQANQFVWGMYEAQLDHGVAKEVARMCLPVNIYTSVIISANYLNWMRFLKLRTHPTAMHEIRNAANQVQSILTQKFPVSTGAWLKDAG